MKPLWIGYGERDDSLTDFTTTSRSVQGKHIMLTDDDLKTHLYGIGAPRTGKSKLIEHVAREFILRGQGFCLIDPHGSLYQELVAWLPLVNSPAKIILFDPSDEERISGFNPFRARGGDLAPHVDRMVQTMMKAWGVRNTDNAPTIERRLTEVLHLVTELGLPLDVARYVLQYGMAEVREHLVSQLSDPFIQSELEDLSKLKPQREFDHEVVGPMNRLFRFIRNRQIRRIIGLSENSIDLRTSSSPGLFCS